MKIVFFTIVLMQLARLAQAQVVCDAWVTATSDCSMKGVDVMNSIKGIPNHNDCQKLYLKTNSTLPGLPCAGGIHLRNTIFERDCSGSPGCQSLATVASKVTHVVLCENKTFKLASVAANVFDFGTENVQKLAIVNMGTQFNALGPRTLSGMNLQILDLRSNPGFTSSSISSAALQNSQVSQKILLPSVNECNSVTSLGFAAEYGAYVGTDLNGTPCPTYSAEYAAPPTAAPTTAPQPQPTNAPTQPPTAAPETSAPETSAPETEPPTEAPTSAPETSAPTEATASDTAPPAEQQQEDGGGGF